MRGGRRGAARHAQHGRIRLRLHRRERPRRRLPQPARPGADERRLVVGLRRGDGGGAGAGLARLRHQRLDPRAGLALRRLRPEADLRPAAADRAPSPSSTASTTSAPSPAPRATSPLAYDALQGPDAGDHGLRAARRRSRRRRSSTAASRGCASASLGGWFDDERRRARGAGRRRRGGAGLGGLTPRSYAGRRGRGGPGGGLPHHQRRERRLPPRAAAGARRRLRSRHPRPLPRRRAAARPPGSRGRSGSGAGGSSAPCAAFRDRRPSASRRRRPAPRRRSGQKTLPLAGEDLAAPPEPRAARAAASPASACRSPPCRSSQPARCRSACSSSRALARGSLPAGGAAPRSERHRREPAAARVLGQDSISGEGLLSPLPASGERRVRAFSRNECHANDGSRQSRSPAIATVSFAAAFRCCAGSSCRCRSGARSEPEPARRASTTMRGLNSVVGGARKFMTR